LCEQVFALVLALPCWWRGAGSGRSEPRDLSPHESEAVGALRGRSLLVHAADEKEVQTDGAVDGAAMREIFANTRRAIGFLWRS